MPQKKPNLPFMKSNDGIFYVSKIKQRSRRRRPWLNYPILIRFNEKCIKNEGEWEISSQNIYLSLRWNRQPAKWSRNTQKRGNKKVKKKKKCRNIFQCRQSSFFSFFFFFLSFSFFFVPHIRVCVRVCECALLCMSGGWWWILYVWVFFKMRK